MAKGYKTEQQKEIERRYRRERRRIQSALYRARQAGYYTGAYNMPRIPKKITEASIRKLQRIDTRSKHFRSTLPVVDYTTGEKLTGAKRREVLYDFTRRKKDEKKHLYIVNMFMTEINMSGNTVLINMIMEWLHRWIYLDGLELVAETLEQQANLGFRISIIAHYPVEQAEEESIEFMNEIMTASGEYSSEIAEEITREMVMY